MLRQNLFKMFKKHLEKYDSLALTRGHIVKISERHLNPNDEYQTIKKDRE